MPLTVDQPVATPGSRILLRATKYDGSAHWIQPFTVIADDGQMVITQYRARTPIFTSRGEFRSPYDSRVYFWRDRWYNVFRLSKPRNDLSLWYCNVTTPLTVQPGQLNYVDLDLDVTVQPDGDIQLLDCDEFELHQKLYDYPPEITQRAEEAADELMELAREGGFPFSDG